MKDKRTIRQIVIDRIEAYVNGLDFYNPELKAEHQYDYENMTDTEIVHTFEMLVFNNHKIKAEYRAKDPHGFVRENKR